jgi:mono/diheme cytochrome c family protein
MAQAPPTGLTKSQCHRLLAMAALGSVLAAPVRAQSETTVRAGRQLATVHCSRCHGIDDERFILRPGALPLRDLKLLYSAGDLGEALAASLRMVHFDLSAIFSREEMTALLSYLNSLW